MPRVAQLIADYKREYYNLQRAMNRLAQKWGGEYELRLKEPLKTPAKANITETVEGLRRIRELRRNGIENILKESTALIESVEGGEAHIVEVDPFLIEDAYREIAKTNRMLREEDKALVKFAKEKFGVSEKDIDRYEKPYVDLYFMDKTGYENIIKGQKAKQSQQRFDKVFMGRADIFMENLDRVMSAYDENIEQILRYAAAKHNREDLIVRFKAWYRTHKSDPTDWVTLWDSINVFKAGRAPDLLRVMGEPSLAQQVQDLAANKDWTGIGKLKESLT